MRTPLSRARPVLLLAAALLAPAAPAVEPPAHRLEVDEPILPIDLIDQDGKPFSLEKGRAGRPVLLTFIFTECPGPCPFVVETALAAARKAADPKDPESKPLVVAVSFDPKTDTPEVLRAYMKQRGFRRSEAVFLTGDPKTIEKLVLDYGVMVGRSPSGDITHSFQTVVISRTGRIIARYYGFNIDGDALLADTKRAAAPRSAFFDFTMKTIDGKDQPLSAYRGQALLVVNTASKCGYTPQYAGLEELYRKYRARGFAVLGFPANNFLWQEPGTDPEIRQFCASKYDVTFPLFSKISVKGGDIHPLYRWLTSQEGFKGDVKWNFNKFLVSPEGKVVARFGSGVEPLSPELTGKLEAILPKK